MSAYYIAYIWKQRKSNFSLATPLFCVVSKFLWVSTKIMICLCRHYYHVHDHYKL